MSNVFEMSIEEVCGRKAIRSGFHLGTIECVARSLCTERFAGRVKAGMPTVTIALMQAGRMVDVFDGRWESDRQAEANALFYEENPCA